MALQYWVDDFFIDVTRNQVTLNQHSKTLPPKALSVLTYLAKNQGRVVSQDELLERVWQGIIVAPNTLQRSIAQLRKALGDDGKGQALIKTHSKQGYSLECEVRWQNNTESTKLNIGEEDVVDEPIVGEILTETSGGTTKASKPSFFWLAMAPIAAAIVILGIVGIQILEPKQASPLTFSSLRSLTATDDKEYDASYTPDGRYIVFHRYLDNQCGNKLWAKNINTQEEIQLTKDWGAYGSHSFSEDGKRLVFIETLACTEPVTQLNCYDLLSLDFARALESPQQPELILQCKNSVVENPSWLNNDNIALLQRTSKRKKLINYSLSENLSRDLYALPDGNLIDYTYSATEDLIAVTSIHSDGQYYIDILNSNGNLLSSNLIRRPKELGKYVPFKPKFDPINKQLVFTTGKQLFTLSYEGEVNKIDIPFDDRMAPSEFHPDGSKLLLIKGKSDSDILVLPRNKLTKAYPHNPSFIRDGESRRHYTPNLQSFERSNLGEGDAIFQPHGDLIAFWSDRSGEEQLWLSNGASPRQLTQFSTDTYIRGFDWAADGTSLLVNANGILSQVFLDSNQHTYTLDYPIVVLYEWDSVNNTALLVVRDKGIMKFGEYDLNNLTFREITDKIVLWAAKSEDGRLIYKDALDQFWQPGPAEHQQIDINHKRGKSKSFIIKGNVIYAIDIDNRLWSYDLNNGLFEVLGNIDKNVNSVSDVSDTQFLLTALVAEKREVVELSRSE